MNQAKAHISFKVLSFADFFSFSDFIKKFGETKKAYSADGISVMVVDHSQIINEDIFSQTILPLGPGGLSLGSPLTASRYVAWQSLPVHLPQSKSGEGGLKDSFADLKEPLSGRDKDKKTK